VDRNLKDSKSNLNVGHLTRLTFCIFEKQQITGKLDIFHITRRLVGQSSFTGSLLHGCYAGTHRPFCSSILVDVYSRTFASARTLSSLLGLLPSLREDLKTCHDGVELMKKCISLKTFDDPKHRGRIPRELVKLVSELVEPDISSLSGRDLEVLVLGLGDNNQWMDEYLLFRIARIIPSKISGFTSHQLITVLGVYCKRDLCDEQLFESILSAILQDASLTLTESIKCLRYLSMVRVRSEELFDRIVGSPGLEKLSSKDAIGLLSATCELDFHSPILCASLWAKASEHKLILSHEEEFGLLFSVIYAPFRANIIKRVLERVMQENRLQRRIKLVRDCLHFAIMPAGTLQPSQLDVQEKPRRGGAISSGLHLEVLDTLQSMGFKANSEIQCSSFMIDIVVER
jgi:hypothetical protein